ncbi:DUF11 domain-containing protein [Chitinophaga sedimenti]|uniref:beta strand repeat-containing protein n=1 Tax=Chitinophaga sedimenti TaxID=2033606 RepID=UPI002005EF86|nr:DUF11 domain-containing protein [Chitinophaga sedimenti]MCK7555991.1 DUF11 domain-containing protein [Chitinophaga sedimenti]
MVDAVITDNLPAGISDATWTVVTAGGATASTTSGTGNVSLTTSMKAGGADKVIITLNAKVDPDLAAGTLVNTAQATPPVGVTDPSPASDTIRSAIGRTANVRVVKSGPADGRAGDQVVYVLRVTNDGPSSAPATSITDNMPAGITAQSWTAVASGGATVSAPSGTGNVSLTADLPAQAGSVEITIVGEVDPALQTGNTVTNSASVAVASGITDPEAANNTSQITTRIDNSATFLVSKSGPANANVGDHVTYTILVKNTGLGNITDALIQDTVPPDVQVTSWQAVANGAAGILSSAPTSGSGNLIATNADIPAGTGNSILLTIQGVILPGAASNFTNRAVVTAGEVKQSSVTTSVNRSTDIAILKAGPQTLAAGEDITYTVNVFNNGNVDVQGLQILDNVYSFTSNVTWEATASGTAAVTGATSGTGNNINITGDIPAGQDNYITLTIRGTLPSSLPNTNILNSASVTLPSGITDYNPSNNVSEITTGVVLRPDIVITKTAPAVANAGEPISFTVNVTNNGPSDAYSVNITDAVNAAITNVNWTGTAANGATISSGGTGSVNNLAAVADIPAGANVTFVITGIINPDFAGNIDNQAGAAVGAALPALSPLVTTVVTKRVSLEMTKSAIDTLSAGLPITYTLEVTNSGPSNTTGSVITDDIPGSIENVAWITTEGNGAVVTAGGTGSGNNLSVTANIPNGGRLLITVTGIVASNTLDDLRNIAVVTPIEPGQEADSSAEVITVIKKTPQLRLLKSAPSTAASGEQITYTLQLSNVGPSDALNTQLSDVVPAEIRNVEWNATVAGGATIVTGQTGTGNNMQLTGNVPAGGAIDVTITGTIDPLFRGVISNTALATPSEDGIPEAQDTVSTLVSPSVNLVINKSGPARINAGDIINYQIMVSNQGPSTALDAVITDVIPAQVVNPQWTAVAQGNAVVGSGSSGSGSSVAVTANIPADDTSYILINISGVVSPAYEGTLSNMADVTAAEDNVVVPSAPVQTIVSRVPIVSISKSAPATLRSGNAISYLITVGNTGTGDAQNMAISDVVPAVLTDVTWEAGSNGAATVSTPSGSGNINLTADIPAGDGNTVTIRVTGNVPETFSGDLVNTAVASPSESSAVADSSTATTAIYRSLITMVKTATNTVTKAGDVITYNLLLTNTGTAPLTDIVVADDGADAGSITPATISGIAPGASVTVTAAHTVTQADVDAGRVTNSANVDARAPDRSGVSDVSGNTADDDEPTVTLITPTPSVTLVKTVAPARAAVGEIVKYAFVVANTGNVTLNNVIVSDANAVVTGSPVTTLAPGDSATLTGEHILTQADVDAGRVANSASVNASPAIGEATRDISGTTAGNNDSTILVLQSAGAITLTKAATNTGAKAGDVINYELVLKNVGNVTLSNFVVADAGADAGSITPATIANLAPGASANITATHTLTQADVDRGIYRNQASVSAVDPQGNAVSLAGSDDPATNAQRLHDQRDNAHGAHQPGENRHIVEWRQLHHLYVCGNQQRQCDPEQRGTGGSGHRSE